MKGLCFHSFIKHDLWFPYEMKCMNVYSTYTCLYENVYD